MGSPGGRGDLGYAGRAEGVRAQGLGRAAGEAHRSRLFWGGKQAATVRGGTAVAGFFGGIVVGHCGLTKWGTGQKFDV